MVRRIRITFSWPSDERQNGVAEAKQLYLVIISSWAKAKVNKRTWVFVPSGHDKLTSLSLLYCQKVLACFSHIWTRKRKVIRASSTSFSFLTFIGCSLYWVDAGNMWEKEQRENPSLLDMDKNKSKFTRYNTFGSGLFTVLGIYRHMKSTLLYKSKWGIPRKDVLTSRELYLCKGISFSLHEFVMSRKDECCYHWSINCS